MYISYKKAINIILKENADIDFSRISVEHIKYMKDVRIISELFDKPHLIVASDVKRKKYNEIENGAVK